MLWRYHAATGTTSHAMARLFTLAGIRLGKHERRILLRAPKPNQAARPIGPYKAGRSASEAHRRALRKLDRIGLVDYWHRYQESGKYLGNEVRRTRLGQAVVDHYRHELEHGQAIRWPRRTR